ncbi:uncharacterized protein N0V89_001217 [Didymosphaeria variabile]|uniref:Heterokaryon incompatibility domain-containing protein n=1 Tax=Didymosphaeria variabile TaxID=1932322 RepID=A0A9W9CGL2_9PLEO|nr:uncharacterized protein N0V89_001217 [Didymosphaeria variabile]KAJ4360651.1 hypothetical protein N0V89_001217 [Didymosphaeria variabile]
MSFLPRTHNNEINNTGNGIHNTRYDQSYLKAHLESYSMKPVSPYDTHDPNEAFYNNPEPNLPCNNPKDPLEYVPLKRPRWIRVLKLEPGFVYMKIRVSLLHLNLDDPSHLPYEAISYTWRAYYSFEAHKDDWKEDIICNGRYVRITRSLFHALSVFRRTDRARIIWADALCINQEDEQEKGHQVGLMQQIYKRAFHVLIWVGYRWTKVVKESMDLVCGIVNQEYSTEERRGVVAEWYDEPSILEMDDVAPPNPDSPSSLYAEDIPEQEEKTRLDAQNLKPLKDLFEALYFSRLWVFQEVALSPLATMCWSQARVRFEWVALVADLISRNPEYLSAFSIYEEAIDGLQNCANMYNAWRGKYAETPFFDLLLSTRALKSGVGRDKVYGLLGIKTSDTDPEKDVVFIKADYAIEERELWKSVALKILVEQGDVRCLAAVNHLNTPTDSPSWIPNFANLSELFLPFLHADAHNQVEKACVFLDPFCRIPDCLSVEANTIDSIVSIIRPDFEFNTHWRHISTCMQLHRLIRRLESTFSWDTLALCLTQGFDFSFTKAVTDITSHIAALRAFYAWGEGPCLTKDDLVIPPSDTATDDAKAAYNFFCASAKAVQGKCLFITEMRTLGIGPGHLRGGCTLVSVHGSCVPFAVRSVSADLEKEHWRLVGPCYVPMADGMSLADRNVVPEGRGDTHTLHIL